MICSGFIWLRCSQSGESSIIDARSFNGFHCPPRVREPILVNPMHLAGEHRDITGVVPILSHIALRACRVSLKLVCLEEDNQVVRICD